jgi:hypothetical protein
MDQSLVHIFCRGRSIELLVMILCVQAIQTTSAAYIKIMGLPIPILRDTRVSIVAQVLVIMFQELAHNPRVCHQSHHCLHLHHWCHRVGFPLTWLGCTSKTIPTLSRRHLTTARRSLHFRPLGLTMPRIPRNSAMARIPMSPARGRSTSAQRVSNVSIDQVACVSTLTPTREQRVSLRSRVAYQSQLTPLAFFRSVSLSLARLWQGIQRQFEHEKTLS